MHACKRHALNQPLIGFVTFQSMTLLAIYRYQDALRPIPRGTQSAHFGGSPIETFPAVTLWRPLQQISVEACLY